jgi:ribosome-binding protein aMBF1 (putative translation factor)
MRATTQRLRPEAAATVALFALAAAGLAKLRRLCRRRRSRSPLRDCPLCGSEAVGTLEYEIIDAAQARVLQQCGACGVWRQTVTSVYLAARHERTLEADRNAIGRSAERLERSRVMSETNAFVATLQDDVVGAEDLLALMRADASSR